MSTHFGFSTSGISIIIIAIKKVESIMSLYS